LDVALPLRWADLTWKTFLAGNEATMDALAGAALVAKDAYPDLDIARLGEDVDALRGPLRDHALRKLAVDEQLAVLKDHFAKVLAFRGNEENYYDERNSYLPDVLAARKGLPIVLCMLYCDIARAAGVRASSVAFPGHVLVRVDGQATGEPIVVDPFYACTRLSTSDLAERLRKARGGPARLTPRHFAPASPRQLVVRMLANLRHLFAIRGDFGRALLASDRLVMLMPSPEAHLERAALALRLDAYEVARADFERFLELAPHASQAGKVRAQLGELGRTVTRDSLN
jgi:regulator of sirC expression with transglutaminase-like and TPR domain